MDNQMGTKNLTYFGIILIITIFGSLYYFGTKYTFPIGSYASGKFIHQGHPLEIRIANDGIIENVNFNDGDKIKKNDVLLTLEVDKLEKQLNDRIFQLETSIARVSRLEAQLNNTNKISFPELKNKNLITQENKLFEEFQMQKEKTIDLYQSRIQNSKNVKIESENIISESEKSLEIIENNYNRTKDLYERDVATLSKLQESENQVVNARERVSQLRLNILRAEQTIKESDIQVQHYLEKINSDNRSELLELLKNISTLETEIENIRKTINEQTITSPIDGEIVLESLPRKGTWASRGQPILKIVPTDAPIHLELKLRPEDADNVSIGNIARITPTGLKTRNNSPIDGKITSISADVIENQSNGTSYFIIKAEIDPQEFKKTYKVDLKSGLPASAVIITRERTLLEYFTSPFIQSFNRSFIEP